MSLESIRVANNQKNLLIETDAPYLAPLPYRGKLNEPSFIIHTLKKLSDAKMINLIGDQISYYRKSPNLSDNEFFFDYKKREIKKKRKMGHITTLI